MKRIGLKYVFLFFILLAAVFIETGCDRTVPEAEQPGGPQAVIPSAGKKPLPAQSLSLLPPDIRWIKERGRIIVAMYREDRPPFFYTNKEGKFVGIDVELARDIARQLQVDVEFDRAAASFEEVVDRVVTGQADLAISKLSITLSRAQRTRYTQPYVTFHQSLLVNRLQLAALEKKHPDKNDLELAKNASGRIGVLAGTSYVEWAGLCFPNAEIVPFNSIEKSIEAVYEGKVFAAFYDNWEIRSFINRNPKLSVYAKMIILEDLPDPISIAVAPQNGQLLAWLNTYLEMTGSSGVIRQKIENYRGEEHILKI